MEKSGKNHAGLRDMRFQSFQVSKRPRYMSAAYAKNFKMASLLVDLHEVVQNYVKKSANKELAGKLGSCVLESARDVVKTCMFNPLNALQYVSVKPMKTLLSQYLYAVWNQLLYTEIHGKFVSQNICLQKCFVCWKIVFNR